MATITGTSANDSLGGTAEDDIVQGFAGDDTLSGGNGNDAIYGGADDDLLGGGVGNDSLFGEEGADDLRGGAGDDLLEGGLGDDTLNGGGGADTLLGGDGNDLLLPGRGIVTPELYTGGVGLDTLGGVVSEFFSEFRVDRSIEFIGLQGVFGFDSADRFDVTAIQAYAAVTTFSMRGGNDLFHGSGVDDYSVNGDEGEDTLYGYGGNDSLNGGFGDDHLYGGDGNDTLVDGYGSDTLDGGGGDDLLVVEGDGYDAATAGDRNSYFGSTGEDTLRVEAEALAFLILDGASSVEVLDDAGTGFTGTAGDDLYRLTGVTGYANGNSFQLGEGNDRFEGADPAEQVFGGAGHDALLGGLGNDTLHGGDGADTLNGGTGDDFLFGGETGDDLRDVIFGGDGNDSADGGAGNDEISGGNGNDTLIGGLGSDTLIGNDGADVILGAGGSDLIFGNAGNDFVNGGFGYDRINGGDGADQFFHLGVADHGSDWIQDYDAAEGDLLTVGIAGATASQFQVNYATTAGAGAAGVAEAFIIYRPTGQILYALVDGGAQSSLNIQIGGQVFDLLV